MIGRCKITLPMMRKILLICLTSSQMQEFQFQWRGKHVRGRQVFFTKYVWIGEERPLTSNISTLLSSWTVQQYQIRQKEWHIISKLISAPISCQFVPTKGMNKEQNLVPDIKTFLFIVVCLHLHQLSICCKKSQEKVILLVHILGSTCIGTKDYYVTLP